MPRYSPRQVDTMIEDIKRLRKDLPNQKAIADELEVQRTTVTHWHVHGTGRLQWLALGALLAGLHTHGR